MVRQGTWVTGGSHPAGPCLECPATSPIISGKWLCLHEACHNKVAARLYPAIAQPIYYIDLSQLPRVSTMDANSKQEKWRDGVLSSLNAAIEAMNLAKELASVTPAKAVFGSVSVLLTMIRVSVLLSD